MPPPAVSTPPPTRILEMATGNWLSRALAVAQRADLFARAAAGLSVEEVGEVLGAPLRPARMMTDVLVAAGLLERRNLRLYPTALADAYLVPGRPHYLGDLIHMFDDRLYGPWGRLEEALHHGRPVVATYREAPPTPEEAARLVREAIQGLHGLTTVAAEAMLEHLDLSACRSAMDLGGGSGAMAITLARHLPGLTIHVIDQAPILNVIAENAHAAGVADRLRLLERNFFVDPLPEAQDLVTLSNILHDWSREQGRVLLGRAFDALRPGGRLVVNEWLIEDDRGGPLLASLLSLCMLVETEAGENLTGQEIAAAMEQTGFDKILIQSTSFPHGIVTGTKP